MKIPTGGLPGPLLWSAGLLSILGVIGLIANDPLLVGLSFGAVIMIVITRR
jgi:hypothetical protein